MASVVENSTGGFYTVAATDPRGAGLTFTISGGADAARFGLTGNQLSFVASPNFDLPGDADGDNVYRVQLRANDGQASATLDLSVTVTNSREGIAVVRVGSGFVDPTSIVAIPGDTQLFITEKGGNIYRFNPATGQRTLFQTIPVTTNGDRGLRAIAVTPDYQTSGLYVAVFARDGGGSLQLRSCFRTAPLGPTCATTIASGAHDQSNNYGAAIGYAPDRRLYVLTGDGGGVRDPGGTAQNEASDLGKLIRLDPNPDPFGGAGAGAPFIRTVLAKGFRNPNGFGTLTGQLVVADRGETRDEINLIRLASDNYGWPLRDGTLNLAASVPAGLTDPVIEYPRFAGGGIVGGVVYQGSVTSLRNFYIFGDESGVIFSIPRGQFVIGTTRGLADLDRRTADFTPDSGALGAPVAFGEDNANELYIANRAGEIFRVTAG